MEALRGQLLVAAPSLLDPNFRRTVVLVAEHGATGALGFVLNRPSEVPVAAAAPVLEPLVDGDELVLVGGPVQPDGLIVLAEWEGEPESAGLEVLPGIGVLTSSMDPADVAARRVRVFAGHAGWGPGQLEGELARDDWFLDPARPEDLFDPAPERLWVAVLERKGGQYALVARMPEDPSLN